MEILLVSKTDECRSRLAEAVLSSYGRGMHITTAGIVEGNAVSELLCDVVEGSGYTVSRAKPMAVEHLKNISWDYVVTLCKEAEVEVDKLKIKTKELAHFDFHRPVSGLGLSAKQHEEQIIDLFEQMDQQLYRFYRDDIRDKLLPTCTCGANTYCRCE